MNHKPNIIGACLAAVVAMAGLAASPVSAATFKVDCDKGQSIQHRLDNNAKPGDTVEVSGTCSENVRIATDDIHLTADTASIIGGPSASPAIFITGRRVHVVGFDEVSSRGSGIIVTDRGSATIRENTFTDTIRAGGPPFLPSGSAIGISNGAYAVVENNVIGVDGGEIQGAGVSITDLASAKVVGNIINKQVARQGIFAKFASVQTEGNDINGTGRDGISALNSSIEIVDDTIDDTVRSGVSLFRSNAVLDGVGITKTGSPRVNVINGSSAQFVDVTITGPAAKTGNGVNVGDTSAAIFSRTEVTFNETGIFVFASSSANFTRGFPAPGKNKINDNGDVGLFVAASHVTLNNSGGDEIKDNGGFGILCTQLGSLSVLRAMTILDNNGAGAEVAVGGVGDTPCSVFDDPAPLPVGDVSS